MKYRFFFPILVIAGLFFGACYYDNEEALYPFVDVSALNDTSQVTFSGTIQPLLQTNCWSCHSNANASSKGNSISLENFADIKSAALNGSLYGSVSWAAFYTPMPKDASKLPSVKIAQIKKWIDQGTPNN